MLTDIFARRYADYPIWERYTENEPRLLQQCVCIAKDALPYYDLEGKVRKEQQVKWQSIHARLARELGLRELWQRYFTTTSKGFQGVEFQSTHTNEWVSMCEMYATFQYTPQIHGNIDRYMKERLSLVELVMRERQNEINELNRTLEQRVADAILRSKQLTRGAIRIPGDAETGVRSWTATINEAFAALVTELNVRFQQAGVPLSYHNGFIQVAKDEQIEKQVAKPFWDAIADPRWENVAIHMNESLDRRDNGAGYAAWFACMALESAIKIVSDLKGWTRGGEKGAHNYIDNLVVQRDGVRYIEPFEMEVLKSYFSHVRNQFGHGPGTDPMPSLTAEQTDWAIEFAMTWIRTLVRRI